MTRPVHNASERLSPLFNAEPRSRWIEEMAQRSQLRLEGLAPPELQRHLEETLYFERKRLERMRDDSDDIRRSDALSKALVRGVRSDQVSAAMDLVRDWTDEIHGRFNPKVYRLATRVGPKALTGLLTANANRWRQQSFDLSRRVVIRGHVAHVRDLIREGTVILAPTHVSNLDSPLLGLSLYLSQMPPFVYGAGLNLFSNPLLGWWLRRLGAYTVDRTKKAPLYKDTLKDYSLLALTKGYHSLFFPGGTRARSGAIEANVRRGLLGTGIGAWQHRLAHDRNPKPIYVVPVTLTFQLVLEAATLIKDHLSDAGKQRYIIDDDEFSQPREVAGFARRLMELDSSVVIHFGQPMDCFGFPVSADPAERLVEQNHRRGFLTNQAGDLQIDPQRDMMYTNRLARSLVKEYPKGTTVMSTHLASWAAWRLLCERFQTQDAFRIVRSAPGQRRFARSKMHQHIEIGLSRAQQQGLHLALPTTPVDILDEALDRFSRYHKTRVLQATGSEICIEDSRLCLFYRNRLLCLNATEEQV